MVILDDNRTLPYSPGSMLIRVMYSFQNGEIIWYFKNQCYSIHDALDFSKSLNNDRSETQITYLSKSAAN